MENEFEIITHRKIKHLNVFINKIAYRNLHMHSDMELLYVLNGEATVMTQTKKYSVSENSFLLFNFNEPHKIDAHTNSVTAVIIQISKHFLDTYYPYFRNTVFLENDISAILQDRTAVEFLPLLRDIALDYVLEKPNFELICVSKISNLLSRLYEHVPYQILSEKEYVKQKKSQSRADRIFSYIEENYQLPIRLSDVANSENITATHLSHFFTANFGISFQKYLNNVRLAHAVRIIEDDSLSLSDVAAASGFSELKYMNREFEKNLGISPKDFRNKSSVDAHKCGGKYIGLLEYKFTNEESRKILSEML